MNGNRWDEIDQEKMNWKRLMRLTVEKKTLEGFLDLELRVEDDEPEGDGEDVVAGSAFEIGSEHVERIVVALLILNRRQMRSSASAGGGSASEDPGRVGGEGCVHRHLLPLYALFSLRLPLCSTLANALLMRGRDTVTHISRSLPLSRLRGTKETYNRPILSSSFYPRFLLPS